MFEAHVGAQFALVLGPVRTERAGEHRFLAALVALVFGEVRFA